MSDNKAAAHQRKPGEICWLEVPVHDLSRAQKLYSDIFGWECQPQSLPTGEHGIKSVHMFSKGAVHGAFHLLDDGYRATQFGKLDKEVLPPLPSFCVDECDATLRKVQAHGGKTQRPKTAIGGGMGHYARFTDTEGNVMGIWSQN